MSCYITSRDHWGFGENAFRALQEKVSDAWRAGVDYILLREKDLGGQRLLDLGERVTGKRPPNSETRLLVNDRADVAIASGADGFHLPFSSLAFLALRPRLPPTMVIGVSCHDASEALAAQQAAADYIVLGPVFATTSKPDATPLGLERFSLICAEVRLPVFALGGVNLSNAAACVGAGAKGIAGIRLFQQSADMKDLAAQIGSL